MAVDTVRLRSPYVSEDLAAVIEAECTKRIGIDMRTGDIMYEITTGQLTGSYDSRISIVVKRKEWRSSPGVKRKGGKAETVQMDCEPFLEIEASVHKLFLGHNIYGGTEDFRSAAVYLIKVIENILGVKLPGHKYQDYERHWLVKRIDFAYVFNLSSFEAIQQFFYLMRNSYYGRREAKQYGLHGLYFDASTTGLKMYHKGPEFRIHDFKRLIRQGVVTESQAWELLTLATDILRVEVEIKTRKLRYDFEKTRRGQDPRIIDITPEYLQGVYETEVNRVMKEGKKSSDVVRDSLDVEERLRAVYSSGKAGILFNAYLRMTNFGVEKYKQTVPKNTYYRHVRELKAAGVSFALNNELNLKDVSGVAQSLLPKDFQPLRGDRHRMVGVDAEIEKMVDDMRKENGAQKKDLPRTRKDSLKDAVNSQKYYNSPF